jgi:hypothetical protein
MQRFLRRLAFFAVIASIITQHVRADSDDDDDDDKPSSPSSSGACEWTVPGTSRTYDLSGMTRSKSDWKAEEDIQGFKFDYFFNICADSLKGCNHPKTSASQYQVCTSLVLLFRILATIVHLVNSHGLRSTNNTDIWWYICWMHSIGRGLE